MEIKDLVLLMLIPLILISLVFYIDKNPIIIGAVTQEQKEESNIIGTYSIMPSFKAKIDYRLDDYTKIEESLDFIIKCSEDSKDVELCMKQAESNDKNFAWSLGCDRGSEKILYEIAEFYQDCFDSEDNNCICKKNLEFSNEEIQKYELLNKIYRMKLIQDIQSQKIDIKMTEPVELSYRININGRSIWYPNEMILAYSERFPLDMIFRYELQDRPIDKPYEIKDKKEIVLYKNQINGLNSVDFIKQQQDNSLIYSNDNEVKPENLHDCQLKPKNIFKFCATKKDSRFLIYDKIDNKVEEKPITIKFAAYIPIKQTKDI